MEQRMSGRKTAGAVIKQTEPAVVAEGRIFGLLSRNYKDLQSGEIAKSLPFVLIFPSF
ncbi:hypothetical protein MR626_11310 [bacterium]|nr:hypothetical protein [bacterium]